MKNGTTPIVSDQTPVDLDCMQDFEESTDFDTENISPNSTADTVVSESLEAKSSEKGRIPFIAVPVDSGDLSRISISETPDLQNNPTILNLSGADFAEASSDYSVAFKETTNSSKLENEAMEPQQSAKLIHASKSWPNERIPAKSFTDPALPLAALRPHNSDGAIPSQSFLSKMGLRKRSSLDITEHNDDTTEKTLPSATISNPHRILVKKDSLQIARKPAFRKKREYSNRKSKTEVIIESPLDPSVSASCYRRLSWPNDATKTALPGKPGNIPQNEQINLAVENGRRPLSWNSSTLTSRHNSDGDIKLPSFLSKIGFRKKSSPDITEFNEFKDEEKTETLSPPHFHQGLVKKDSIQIARQPGFRKRKDYRNRKSKTEEVTESPADPSISANCYRRLSLSNGNDINKSKTSPSESSGDISCNGSIYLSVDNGERPLSWNSSSGIDVNSRTLTPDIEWQQQQINQNDQQNSEDFTFPVDRSVHIFNVTEAESSSDQQINEDDSSLIQGESNDNTDSATDPTLNDDTAEKTFEPIDKSLALRQLQFQTRKAFLDLSDEDLEVTHV